MPAVSFKLNEDDMPAAFEWLNREVERLEAAGKQRIVIRYPRQLARELKIDAAGQGSRFGKHEARPLLNVPYWVVIEFED